MRAIKENLGGIVTCLFELIVGILLLIDPSGFTAAIITTAGVFLALTGLFSVIRYFRTEPVAAMKSQLLSKGLAALLCGGFCITKSLWLVALLVPVLTLVYGTVILVTGLTKVQWMFDIIRLKKKMWFLAAISAIISIACGVVVIANPFASTAVLWMFIGISLIVEAVFDVFSLIFGINKKEKPAPEAVESEDIEAEPVEE